MINMVQKNLPAKIISLVVAIALWFFVMTEQNPVIEGTFTVPVQVVNAPTGYSISRSVDNVRIKVRGQRSLFATATEADFKAYVDLHGIDEGKQAVKVQYALPQGFEFVEISPETVTVMVDRNIQKQFKAEMVLSGNPAAGLKVANVSSAVQQVTVEGPRSAVNTVSRVVGYIGLAGNTADFNGTVPLVALNEDGKEVADVKIIPPTVEVSVSLTHGQTKKTVSVKTIVGTDLPAKYTLQGIKAEPVKVEITGDEKLVEAISEMETEKISLADAAAGTVKREVKLKVPDGITVTNKNINVTIDVTEKK